jgi:hypothetical protein
MPSFWRSQNLCIGSCIHDSLSSTRFRYRTVRVRLVELWAPFVISVAVTKIV